LPIASAELRVGDRNQTMATGESDRAAVFRLPLKAGSAELEASFKNADGQRLCAAFFVTVWRVD
jgi:hypothetical protein